MSMDEYLKGVVPSEVPASWPVNALKAQAVAARSYASVNFRHASQGADVCTSTHCQVWKAVQYERTSQAVDETSNFSAKYNGAIINALFFSHCNGTTRNNESVWGGTPVPYLRSISCPCGYTAHNAHGVGMCQYGSRALALRDSSWESILRWYYTGISIDKTQLVKGTLRGVIYHGSDNSNLSNRIQGATVRLHTGEEMRSGVNGVYSFDLVPGNYTVTASLTGFRPASVNREVTAGNTVWGSIELVHNVGVNNAGKSRVWFYPNPANELLWLVPEGTSIVTITGLPGKPVWTATIYETTVLDVSHFEPGIYIIRTNTGGNIRTEKLVITD